MYAANNPGAPSVAVWGNLAAVTAPTAPMFSMSGPASGLPASGFLTYVTVAQDVLIVVVQTSQVNLYKNASALSGNAVPSAVLAASLVTPVKAILSKSLRLYVLDSDGVAIFKDVTTTPAFVAKLKTGLSAPKDFVLLE